MNTKTNNAIYWISTIIFAGLMAFSAIPNMLTSEDSVKLIHDYLGFPVYIIPFIGVAKLLGVIVILIPGFKRIKEWAYAGLFFDLTGALYSAVAAAGTFDPMLLTLLAWVIPGIISYVFWHKKIKASHLF